MGRGPRGILDKRLLLSRPSPLSDEGEGENYLLNKDCLSHIVAMAIPAQFRLVRRICFVAWE